LVVASNAVHDGVVGRSRVHELAEIGYPAAVGECCSPAWGAGSDAQVHESGTTTPARPHRIGTVLAWTLFVVVLLGALLGILYIVASGLGMKPSFAHIYPTVVHK
jgi:hypothetical protein